MEEECTCDTGTMLAEKQRLSQTPPAPSWFPLRSRQSAMCSMAIPADRELGKPELKPFQSLCPFYCPTSLPASIWHAYSQRGFVPNFVLNKTNIRKNMHRTKRYHFKILSFLESLKEWMRHVLARRKVGFSFQRMRVGRGVCHCSLLEGWKDVPRLLGVGILYQVQW